MPTFLIDLSHPSGVPTVVEGLGIANPILETHAIRGTAPEYRVRFAQDGALYRPPGISLSYIVKETGKFDGDALVSAVGGAWTTPATDTEYYVAAVNYGTDELNALLFSPDGNAANDIAELVCMGAFSFRVGAGPATECARISVVIANKVITGDEADPVPGPPDLDARIAAVEATIGLGAGQSYTSTAFLSGDGDDATAAIGNPFKPYATPQAAWDAGATTLAFFPNPGGYSGIFDTGAISLTLFSFAAATFIGNIQSPAGVTITGNGANLISINAIQTYAITSAVTNGIPAGPANVRGCSVESIDAHGGYTGFPTYNGGAGGDITLRDSIITNSINRTGGTGGSGGGSTGAAGALIATFTEFVNDPGAGTFAVCIASGALIP